MQLDQSEIHVITAPLKVSAAELIQLLSILNQAEQQRAKRFVSSLHQHRFIVAHAYLRMILSLYMNVLPSKLQFRYSKHHKPSLPKSNIYFNLSHSHDIAVYAISHAGEIGIDIEKIRFNADLLDIAKRFFSDTEKSELSSLPPDQRTDGFFQIWSRKEAVIKANGKGLSQVLSSFSVSAQPITETITVNHDNWTITPLTIHPAYASSLAFAGSIQKISIWDFKEQNTYFRSSFNLPC